MSPTENTIYYFCDDECNTWPELPETFYDTPGLDVNEFIN